MDSLVESKGFHKVHVNACFSGSNDVIGLTFSAGINRLLGNNTYEAAFPPHEVRVKFVLKHFNVLKGQE